jgi:hypothetical protein
MAKLMVDKYIKSYLDKEIEIKKLLEDYEFKKSIELA